MGRRFSQQHRGGASSPWGMGLALRVPVQAGCRGGGKRPSRSCAPTPWALIMCVLMCVDVQARARSGVAARGGVGAAASRRQPATTQDSNDPRFWPRTPSPPSPGARSPRFPAAPAARGLVSGSLCVVVAPKGGRLAVCGGGGAGLAWAWPPAFFFRGPSFFFPF